MVDNLAPQFFDISSVYSVYWDEPPDDEFLDAKLRWTVQNPIVLNEDYQLIESFLAKD